MAKTVDAMIGEFAAEVETQAARLKVLYEALSIRCTEPTVAVLKERSREEMQQRIRERLDSLLEDHSSHLRGTPEIMYLRAVAEEYGIDQNWQLHTLFDYSVRDIGLPTKLVASLERGFPQMYVGHLVNHTEKELRRYGCGAESIQKIRETLQALHPALHLGMKVDYTRPENRK